MEVTVHFAMRRISLSAGSWLFDAFRRGLRERGYVEDQNLATGVGAGERDRIIA